MLQYRIKKIGISGEDAFELPGRGYSVQLKDSESGMEWKVNVELSRMQEDIRNMVYKS